MLQYFPCKSQEKQEKYADRRQSAGSLLAQKNRERCFFMRFLIRSAKPADVPNLYRLAGQVELLNLPPDKAIIRRKVNVSMRSFASSPPPADAEYVFVLEDLESNRVIGSSLIIAHYASPENPHFYLDIIPRVQFHDAVPAGSRKGCLKLELDTGGISTVGGLIVDADYRGRKLGRSISLIRFVYMCMFPERFERKVLSQLAGPTIGDNINPFWEALGRRFTGLPYDEAFKMAVQKRRDYLDRFPREDIQLRHLDAEIRPCRERVVRGSGQAEQHLLESVGFRYLNKVDPLDGGIMYGALRDEISIVRDGACCRITPAPKDVCPSSALVGMIREGQFLGGQFPIGQSSHTTILPEEVFRSLCLTDGDRVCVVPFTRASDQPKPALDLSPPREGPPRSR